MTDMTKAGQDILAAQSFSRWLGAELTHLSADAAEIKLAISEDFKQQHGFVHGGVISYLADNTLTFAGGAALGGGGVVTTEMKINYIRPARGETLVARAAVIGVGKSQAVVRCDVFAVSAGDERLCAAAQGTISVLPKRED